MNNYFIRLIPDKIYLKMIFKKHMGKKLNLKNPETFNEKLQWLKLNDRNPMYTSLVDKYEVRKHIKTSIGNKYLIPLLGVWERTEDIDFDSLPDKFVLKCNHDSGGVIICKNKNLFNKENAIRFLNKQMKVNYYYGLREWPYKNIKPKIIAEKYMEDQSGGLVDYKFFCFDGYVDCVMICIDRNIGDPKFYFFDKNWNLLRINQRAKTAPKDFTLPKPNCMDEMFKIAASLTKGFPFVRIDLYQCNNNIYFGEFTFYPQSGLDNNLLPETDIYFGQLIKIGDKHYE